MGNFGAAERCRELMVPVSSLEKWKRRWGLSIMGSKTEWSVFGQTDPGLFGHVRRFWFRGAFDFKPKVSFAGGGDDGGDIMVTCSSAIWIGDQRAG